MTDQSRDMLEQTVFWSALAIAVGGFGGIPITGAFINEVNRKNRKPIRDFYNANKSKKCIRYLDLIKPLMSDAVFDTCTTKEYVDCKTFLIQLTKSDVKRKWYNSLGYGIETETSTMFWRKTNNPRVEE